jgi:serine/threonine protein kinase
MVPKIGEYWLVGELARGGMGNVYLAVTRGPRGFSKLVVMYVTMFLDEARLAARLVHPNIVQTNEVGSDGRRQFLVMEFLEGRSLRRIGQRLGRRMPLGAHLRTIAESLAGLHHAHEMRDLDGRPLSIVHRDVSPLNVFVTFTGQAKVLDFGVAKALDSSLETRVGMVKGRVAYMAPEQARGAKVDRRADVYAAGVMIWEAVAERRLWPGLGDAEILPRLFEGNPPALRSVRPDVPADLEAICARAMAHRPDDRHPTADELQRDLEAHLARRQDDIGMRALGALIAREFNEEQRFMSAAVEATLRRLNEDDAPEQSPSSLTPVVDSMPDARPGPERSLREPSRLFFEDVPPSRRATTDPARAPHKSVSLARSVPALSATLPPSGASATPSTRAPAMLLSVAGALLLAAVLLSPAFHRSAAPALTTPAWPLWPASPAASASSGAADPSGKTRATTALVEPEPDSVDLVVEVTPAGADIALDGVPVGSAPLRRRYVKDGRSHSVDAAAPGYEAKTEIVTFTNDVSVDMTLDHKSSNPAPRAAPRRRRPLTDPPGNAPAQGPGHGAGRPLTLDRDPLPRARATPARPIATDSPYGPF